MANLMDHPSDLAREIARLLDSDPVAAGQVKEHLSLDRIAELFDLPPRKFEDASIDEALESFSDAEINGWVRANFTRTEVLKLFGG